MPSNVEKLNPTRVKLTVEIPFSDLETAITKAYRDISQQVNIPGFRKGKVPPLVIDQRFGRGVVLEEAMNKYLPDAYSKAVEENKLATLGQPDIEVTKLEDHKLVEFTAEVDIRPEFELPDFSEITVEVDNSEVTDEQLDERLNLLRERFATLKEVDREGKDGDVVVVDIVGSREDEELSDAKAEGVSYKLGSGGMIEGFDENVTGLKAGEQVTFESKLIGGQHRGESADVTVTVKKVQEQELPDIDDEFAQMVSEFDTVDEMKKDLTKGIELQARANQLVDARDKVLEEIIKKVDFELPEKLSKNEIAARRQQIESQLANAGMSLEQYLQDSPDIEAENEEEFWNMIEKQSFDALRAQILLDKLADDKEFSVDQRDLSELLLRKARENGSTPEQEAKHMMDHGHLPEWMQEIRRAKALANMVEQATIKDRDGNEIKPEVDKKPNEETASVEESEK